MKSIKFLLLPIFVLVMPSVFAQIDYNQSYAFDVYLITKNREIKNNGEISEAKIVVTDKKGTETYIKKFNEKGQVTEYYRGKNDDSIVKKAVFTYDDKNQFQKAAFYRKHELKYYYQYTFNDAGKLSQLLKNDEKGEVKQNRVWKYNTEGYVEEATISKDNSMEVKATWKYEYYDKGKLSHAYWYKKGKLKREWDYRCTSEGEEVSRKNLFKVCQWHESDKDTLTAIYQSTDHKGRIRKAIYKYTIKDTLILAQYNYNDENELITKSTYDKSYDKPNSYWWYKKGEAKFESHNVYSDDKIISSYWVRKGEITGKQENVYDENGRLTEIKSTGTKKRHSSNTKIEYVLR